MASVLHYHVQAKKLGVKIPAPHHNSHVLTLPEAFQRALGVKTIGSDEGFVCLCNPSIVTDGVHGATGEAHAVTCLDCMGHEMWQADIVKNPHPRVAKQLLEEELRLKELEKGCCG